ncbi:glycosyltransferase family 2 protein [Nonomuraea soli]|uniref:Glycosyltransferase involved in cell wall biosynthesis n=1 Tax=Nonomuraea soli TaxID=1032476 RepID=A0A7W0CVJ7_9ACTN|nr:glycosyltransferase family A protein [Nonomuraea soli]MBA2897980.1 glycosyltransferase involved in cell wall biosynthesis [Nonomuraea soli]
MLNPLDVSVVIATRDRLPLLRRAVVAVFDQDHPGDIEVVVVFDQSEPVELGIAVRPGRTLRVVRNDHAPGLAGARNTGIAAATGEFVAFCDDDDEWLPAKIRLQLAARGEADAIASGIEIVSGDSATTRLVPYGQVTHRHLLRDRVMELHPSSLVVRRSTLLEIGPVDERLPGSYAEDYDLLLRIARRGPIPCVPQALVRVNWGGSFFADRFAMIADALTYLLGKHPEFATEPVGLARIRGQVAFYRAASGDHATARRWAARALAANWREPRAVIALAMGLRLVTARRTLAVLNARGRGV